MNEWSVRKKEKGVCELPAKCVSPSRLVGMLLWVLWVFLRWRVCNATMAGSWLLRHRDNGSQSSTTLNECRCLFGGRCEHLANKITSSYRNWACISGLLFSMSVCR